MLQLRIQTIAARSHNHVLAMFDSGIQRRENPNMESNPNPYASPAVPAGDPETHPPLPIFFCPSSLSFFIAMPFAIALLAITLIAALVSTGSKIEIRTCMFALLIGLTSAAGAAGCLSVIWSQVVVTDHAIEKHGFVLRVFPYRQIESWHHDPITNMVLLSVKEKHSRVQMQNWAMSRKKHSVLGKVLREKVGPPEE